MTSDTTTMVEAAPVKTWRRSLGRRGERARCLANARVYNRPPDPKNPGNTSEGTMRALVRHQLALKKSEAWGGGEGRCPKAEWEPGHDYAEGQGVRHPGAKDRILVCIQSGMSGSALDPSLLARDSVVDGDGSGAAIWRIEQAFPGRPGYGSMNMRELFCAMRSTARGAQARSFRNERKRHRRWRRGLDVRLTAADRKTLHILTAAP